MILAQIAEATARRVERDKQRLSPDALIAQAQQAPVTPGFPFQQALVKPGLSFICEVKKASPSKGVIAADFPYLEIASQYQAAGADAISVLTEPDFFLGGDDYLREISAAVALPCLRKDFIIDEYQIYQAKCLGASAVLLICSLLSGAQLQSFRELAESLGLSALVEAHDEAELAVAVDSGARIIGVNNRNLKTFEVDLENAARLREMVPDGVLFVSESGVHSPADARAAEAIGADAVLVGESMMRATDKTAFLQELRHG